MKHLEKGVSQESAITKKTTRRIKLNWVNRANTVLTTFLAINAAQNIVPTINKTLTEAASKNSKNIVIEKPATPEDRARAVQKMRELATKMQLLLREFEKIKPSMDYDTAMYIREKYVQIEAEFVVLINEARLTNEDAADNDGLYANYIKLNLASEELKEAYEASQELLKTPETI